MPTKSPFNLIRAKITISTTTMTSSASPAMARRLPALLSSVLALCAAYPVLAQTAQTTLPSFTPASGPAPSIYLGQQGQAGAQVGAQVDYRLNAAVAEIQVETDRNNIPADGQSPVLVKFKLLDKNAQPLKGSAFITVEASGGRILQRGAHTDELGPVGLDQDRVTPGVQIKVEHGVGSFWLLAPVTAQDVTLRVSAGGVAAEGQIAFVPELRKALAVGLLEGVISRRTESGAANTSLASRFNDGFEQDIQRWSRQFNQGKANYGARAAFFVKSEVGGDTLLTSSYDSDKAARSRLLRDLSPNEFYPVYGDSALTGFDARSSERLYLRLDQQKNYALYGDFTTGGDELKLNGSGPALRKLGQYQRSATGLRVHYENAQAGANLFAIHDDLKQVIEEYRANGTSGPFAVRNNNAITNSEKVEIIVRDKNQSDRVLQVIPLTRFDDYSFEPFDGRLLFKQPIASLTPNGDPQSLRVTYEVEQGGDKFWVGGADAQLKLGSYVTVGGSVVDDQNPQSPYRLQSADAAIQLGPQTRLVAEVAHSTSTSYQSGGQVFSTPSGQAGELGAARSGNAGRLELAHQAERWQTTAFWQRADENFNNTASGLSAGRSEAGVKFSAQASDTVKVYAEAQRSADHPGSSGTDARRDAERVGIVVKVSERLRVDASLAHIKENGSPGTLGNALGLAGSNAPLGTGQNSSGGFFGAGSSDSVLSPITGTTINGLAANQSTQTGAAANHQLDASTVRLAAQYQVSDKWSVNGDVEHSISGDTQRRYGLGTQYQLSERSKAYARYENQTGLASAYSLNSAERSNSFVAGVDTTYLPGASVFSEYRLRDALSNDYANQRDLQLATGLRNTWNPAQGVALSTNAEYLHVISGAQQTGLALAGGVDYSVNPLWKASAKLELRRLFDNHAEAGDQSQQQWISTLSFARKLNRDWTLLTRNYALYTRNHDNASGAPVGNVLQDRAQLGFAWRPVDHNQVNALARYEFKTVKDHAQTEGDNYTAHILSTHVDYHPSRPWWTTGRIAAKATNDRTLPIGQQRYSAYLLGGRIVYDITENWDLSVLAAYTFSPQGSTRQSARGVEAGYLLKQNLWLSAGYNQTGFSDRDLSGADYTARGIYLRLRFKFDETVFSGNSPAVNRSLAR
jgi:hypothetical protein